METMIATGIAQQAIEWSVAARIHPGQSVSGDLHLVVPTAEGVLIAAIDGLGHGEEAVAAARAAAAVLERHAEAELPALVERCHRELRQTRGVVLTVLSLRTGTDEVSALGIGNVETVIVRADPRARPRREHVLLRGGVVGYRLPPLRCGEHRLARGDLVVFATDGVREDFSETIEPGEPLPQLAARLIAQNFRGTDDGLVLACRYVGKP